jgi:hypothetical protein
MMTVMMMMMINVMFKIESSHGGQNKIEFGFWFMKPRDS